MVLTPPINFWTKYLESMVEDGKGFSSPKLTTLKINMHSYGAPWCLFWSQEQRQEFWVKAEAVCFAEE